jgi:fucose 4-O-acetylase-like acetyltransferase
MALWAFLTVRIFGSKSFSPMRQLGQTSLLVYWVHVELVYGLLFGRLHHRLSMTGATVGLVLMTGAMLLLSVLRTRYWRGWSQLRNAARRKGGNLPSAPQRL